MARRKSYYEELSADYSTIEPVPADKAAELIELAGRVNSMCEDTLPTIGPDYPMSQIEAENKAKVKLEERRTAASTAKLVAELAAEGEKKAKEIEATTEKRVAEIDAKTATIAAQSTTVLGQASARSVELLREAEADRFRQYVKALGGAEAYNRYVFAEGLPAHLRLGVFYAGPGTFWTDLKGLEQTMLGKLASETPQQAAAPTAERSRPPTAPVPVSRPSR